MYTPVTTIATPASARRWGTSRSAKAAIIVAKSGTVLISGLVRAAPMRFWLALRNVHPMKKWKSPAIPKLIRAGVLAARSRLHCPAAREIAARTSVLTISCRNVET